MGRLTTHVLDTATGKPAVGVVIELWRIGDSSTPATMLRSVRTNHDGRVDQPLLEGDDFCVGTYELVFAIGNYFATQPVTMSSPPFLDRVPVRFAIADAEAHYHVPLLVSPWSYSTYRGS